MLVVDEMWNIRTSLLPLLRVMTSHQALERPAQLSSVLMGFCVLDEIMIDYVIVGTASHYQYTTIWLLVCLACPWALDFFGSRPTLSAAAALFSEGWQQLPCSANTIML
jgi:hypothetical protein